MLQIADSMEVMVLSILGPVMVCEWRLNLTEEAFITTVRYVVCFIVFIIMIWTIIITIIILCYYELEVGRYVMM